MDKSLIYLRKQKSVDILLPKDNKHRVPYPKSREFHSDTLDQRDEWGVKNGDKLEYNISNHCVGFCGKIYKVYKVICHGRYNTFTYSKEIPPHSLFFYSFSKLDEFIQSSLNDKKRQKYLTDTFTFGDYGDVTRYRLKSESEAVDALIPSITKYFQEYKVPVFSYHFDVDKFINGKYVHRLELNSCLNDDEFYKVFPPPIAHQEISMYLSGVLGNCNPPIPSVSNDDLVVAKGFDLKTSFRKDKTSKKRR